VFKDFFQPTTVKERKDFAVLGGEGGCLVEFTVREREGARGITLSINHSRGLVATIPPRTPPGELTAFLLRKEKWILAKLDYYASFPKPSRIEALAETGAARVRFLGAYYALKVMPASSSRIKVELDEQATEIRVYCSSPRLVRRALVAWYRKQAERVFAARARAFAEEMGLRVERIFIRSPRTNWGTCSAKRNLGFNWRLVLAPLPIIDYVVVHELAHLAQLNHSPDFWKIVGRYCPDFKERRKWLRENERELAF
jgi:predicted metal-dependent hydrolase